MDTASRFEALPHEVMCRILRYLSKWQDLCTARCVSRSCLAAFASITQHTAVRLVQQAACSVAHPTVVYTVCGAPNSSCLHTPVPLKQQLLDAGVFDLVLLSSCISTTTHLQQQQHASHLQQRSCTGVLHDDQDLPSCLAPMTSKHNKLAQITFIGLDLTGSLQTTLDQCSCLHSLSLERANLGHSDLADLASSKIAIQLTHLGLAGNTCIGEPPSPNHPSALELLASSFPSLTSLDLSSIHFQVPGALQALDSLASRLCDLVLWDCPGLRPLDVPALPCCSWLGVSLWPTQQNQQGANPASLTAAFASWDERQTERDRNTRDNAAADDADADADVLQCAAWLTCWGSSLQHLSLTLHRSFGAVPGAVITPLAAVAANLRSLRIQGGVPLCNEGSSVLEPDHGCTLQFRHDLLHDLSALKQLTHLSLANGTVSAAASCMSCTVDQTAAVVAAPLTAPLLFSGLTSLQCLQLCTVKGCNSRQFVAGLAQQLPQLYSLQMSNCGMQIDHLTPLRDLAQLKELHLLQLCISATDQAAGQINSGQRVQPQQQTRLVQGLRSDYCSSDLSTWQGLTALHITQRCLRCPVAALAGLPLLRQLLLADYSSSMAAVTELRSLTQITQLQLQPAAGDSWLPSLHLQYQDTRSKPYRRQTSSSVYTQVLAYCICQVTSRLAAQWDGLQQLLVAKLLPQHAVCHAAQQLKQLLPPLGMLKQQGGKDAHHCSGAASAGSSRLTTAIEVFDVLVAFCHQHPGLAQLLLWQLPTDTDDTPDGWQSEGVGVGLTGGQMQVGFESDEEYWESETATLNSAEEYCDDYDLRGYGAVEFFGAGGAEEATWEEDQQLIQQQEEQELIAVDCQCEVRDSSLPRYADITNASVATGLQDGDNVLQQPPSCGVDDFQVQRAAAQCHQVGRDGQQDDSEREGGTALITGTQWVELMQSLCASASLLGCDDEGLCQ